MIYLDNAASTPVDDQVIARMTEIMRAAYGNPSAAHPAGAAARRAIAVARARCWQPSAIPRARSAT
jgi:cysteine desulfurase